MNNLQHPLTKRMMSPALAGVIVPVFTPCLPGGAIDWDGFRNFVAWLGDHPSITALFVRCGLGKMYTYTLADTKRAIDITMETLDGKKPAMFGTFGEHFRTGMPSGTDLSHHRTIGKNRPDPKQYLDQTIELTEYAREKGAMAGVLVVPAALRPSEGSTLSETIFDYYRSVAESTDLPLFIYNTPTLPKQYRTSPEMAARVARLDNVIGMKLSSDDMKWLTQIIMATADSEFTMIAGSECTCFHALASGASGVIGQGCDVYPEILRAVFERFMSGDFSGALEAQQDVLRALSFFKGLDAPRSGLAYLKRKGLRCEAYGRFGEPPVPENKIKEFEEELDRLIGKYRK